MSEINLDEISHLADLARLELTQAEKEKFASELPAIISFVEQLRSFSPSSDTNVETTITLESLREDEVREDRERLTVEQIQKLAPNFDFNSNQLVVPAVFGDRQDD